MDQPLQNVHIHAPSADRAFALDAGWREILIANLVSDRFSGDGDRKAKGKAPQAPSPQVGQCFRQPHSSFSLESGRLV